MFTWFQVGMMAEEIGIEKKTEQVFLRRIPHNDFLSYVNGRESGELVYGADSFFYPLIFDMIIGY